MAADNKDMVVESESVSVETDAVVDARQEIVTAVPKDESKMKDPDTEMIVETKGSSRLNSAILVFFGIAIGIIFSSLVVSVMWGTIFQSAVNAIG